MNYLKLFFCLLSSFCSSISIGQAVTNAISATAGNLSSSIFDGPTGSNLAPVGTLGLLIVDTEGDGISLFTAAPIDDETFFNGTDDYIGGIASSSEFFGTASVAFSNEEVSNPLLSAGDEFYIAWFPGIAASATELTSGADYGLVRGSDWVLAASGSVTEGSVTGGNTIFSVGGAIAVPEPSTYAAILGFLAFGFVAYKRRRSM